MKQLVAFDLDGTLAESKQPLKDDMGEALADLLGVADVAVISGGDWPQFDKQGYVFALAHEDDVKILRWREKYDSIPEDTKDFAMLAAKKALKKKMPTRRSTEQYWSEQQFEQLRTAPPSKLTSKGPLPWRLLAYMLTTSPDVRLLRDFAGKRLLEGSKVEQGQRQGRSHPPARAHRGSRPRGPLALRQQFPGCGLRPRRRQLPGIAVQRLRRG